MFTHNAHHLYENAKANMKDPAKVIMAREIQLAFREGGLDPINQHQMKNIISRAVMAK